MKQAEFCIWAQDVIRMEAQAVATLGQRIDARFSEACRCILATKGRVVVTGMGKSGHIARKIAATLASTGTPAFFLHPAEASHGDLGMVTSEDIVLAISHSGNTEEIVALFPSFQKLGVRVIAFTGNPEGALARYADITFDLSIEKEACPLGLAPTTSTTLQLVMGDALAVALLKAKSFLPEQFAFSHPGGSLAKQLLLTADALAHHGSDLPVVHETMTVRDALIEVTAKKLGMTCVVNDQRVLTGIYTDGDVRRTLMKNMDLARTAIVEVMTHPARSIPEGTLAVEALATMNHHAITALVIVNQHQQPVAVVHLHDVLRAGIVPPQSIDYNKTICLEEVQK